MLLNTAMLLCMATVMMSLTSCSGNDNDGGNCEFANNFVTPEMFGCKSNDAGAADRNVEGLQKAINTAVEEGKTLTASPGKTYYISKGLTMGAYLNMNFGGATIVATKPMSMITINNTATERLAGVISNFRLDLNNVAGCGINCESIIKMHFTDAEIFNIGQGATGMNIKKGYEAFVDNIHFRGSANGSTGIAVNTSDCHISDCVMIDCHTAVKNTGSNYYTRIHAWMTGKHLLTSEFFNITGSPVFLSQCQCDTFDYGIVVSGNTQLHVSDLKLFQNLIFWNMDASDIHPYLFKFASQEVANNSKVTLINSYVGSLMKDGKNRQLFSNLENHHVEMIGTTIQQ